MSISDINPPVQLATVQFVLGGGAMLRSRAPRGATPAPGPAPFPTDGGRSSPTPPPPTPINFPTPAGACTFPAPDDPPHRLIITTIETDGSINPSAPRCFFRG